MAIGDEEYHKAKIYDKHSAVMRGFLRYATGTRILHCMNTNCKFHSHYKGEADCDFKEIAINENGKCIYMEPKGEGD